MTIGTNVNISTWKSGQNQPVWGNDHFGVFTEAFISIWDYGRFKGTYEALFKEVEMRYPKSSLLNK